MRNPGALKEMTATIPGDTLVVSTHGARPGAGDLTNNPSHGAEKSTKYSS